MHHYQPVEGMNLARNLKRNSRWRDTRTRAIDELAHPLRFRALHGDQAHMAADVIAIAKGRQIGFVGVGVLFQTLNAFLD
jgi:hypothetical protein